LIGLPKIAPVTEQIFLEQRFHFAEAGRTIVQRAHAIAIGDVHVVSLYKNRDFQFQQNNSN